MNVLSSDLLDKNDHKIVCMDISGCGLPFPDSELKKFLHSKLLSKYERVRQANEIKEAGFNGLQDCPHCDYRIVIEDPEETLFRCRDENCGAVTCLKCKKPVSLFRFDLQSVVTSD